MNYSDKVRYKVRYKTAYETSCCILIQREAIPMHQTPDIFKINALKKELSSCIVAHNYNLLSPETLSLSHEIDELLLPIFKTQLELYNFYKQYKK